MANPTAPSSQKAGVRPISFLLDDQSGTNGAGFAQSFVDLVIRPEDLVRTDPSRLLVQQTLGGAWADNFGPGIAQINISGHTGWRPSGADQADGVARFSRLKSTVYNAWHEGRARSVQLGVSPDTVKLIFSDALDNFAAVVAPMTFTLRRNRQRPLLVQYQISLLVLDTESVLEIATTPGKDAVEAAGLDSLSASVDRITANINGVKAYIDATLVAPVQAFMQQTARLYGSVRGVISAGTAVVGSVLNVARLTAQAGVNLFRTLAAVASIPQLAKASLMSIGGAYSNILCILHNALQQKLFYQDYSDLYGASNCSSTSGGRPISSLAGENPFYKVVPTAGPSPFSVSQPAQSSLLSLGHSDPVLAPLSTSNLASAMRSVTDGLVVF